MRKDAGGLYDGTKITALSDLVEEAIGPGERGAKAASCEFVTVGGLAHFVGLVPLPNIEIYLHYRSLSDLLPSFGASSPPSPRRPTITMAIPPLLVAFSPH